MLGWSSGLFPAALQLPQSLAPAAHSSQHAPAPRVEGLVLAPTLPHSFIVSQTLASIRVGLALKGADHLPYKPWAKILFFLPRDITQPLKYIKTVLGAVWIEEA